MNQIKQMEHMTELCERRSWDGTISFATLMTDFPVKWTAGAFVLFIDSNPSFAALNLAEDRAQLSINSSNKPSDTSIICLALAHCVLFFLSKTQTANYVSNHNGEAHYAFISGKKRSFTNLFFHTRGGQDIMIMFFVYQMF